MEFLYYVVCWLVIIGAFNWGLVGVFDFNLVTWLTQDLLPLGMWAEKFVYTLVGLSAVMLGWYKMTYDKKMKM
jgi:uncharacterized membrane protein YuzA (DUF378 family)